MIYGILFDTPKPKAHHAKKRNKNKDQRCYGKFLVQFQSAKPVSHFSSPSFLFGSVTLLILPVFSLKSNFFRKIIDKKRRRYTFFPCTVSLFARLIYDAKHDSRETAFVPLLYCCQIPRFINLWNIADQTFGIRCCRVKNYFFCRSRFHKFSMLHNINIIGPDLEDND